jgi:hypothetical protein
MNKDIVKAREVLHNVSGHDYDSCGNYPLERREAEKIINILNKFISKNIDPRWIPCSDHLPDGYCLFCDTDGDIYYGHIYDNKWWAEGQNDKIKNVVAWMPLPEPFKSHESGVEE